MGTLNKSWHAANDTPEQIQMCLNCKRPKCVNCIASSPERIERERERSVRRYLLKSGSIIVNGHRLNKATQAMLRLYPTAKSDKEIAEAIGRAPVSVLGMRRKLDLPPISLTSSKERAELVRPYLQAMGVA